MKETKVGASDYLALGLYAFAGFGLEVVLSMLLPMILGVKGSEYTLVHHCIHWTLTCLLWGSMALFLIRLSKKKYAFDIMRLNDVPDSKRWLLAVVVSLIAIIVTTVAWGGFKPVQEYKGIVTFIFQNIYYLFEAALILLTIAFGQKFGETLFKKGSLPYGGIFLALTWGLIHILLQGTMTGVYAVFMSLLYGLVYILPPEEYPVLLCDDRSCIYSISTSSTAAVKARPLMKMGRLAFSQLLYSSSGNNPHSICRCDRLHFQR